MANRKQALGLGKIEVLNALREVEEENRVGRYRTVPYPCARDKLAQLRLIDTDADMVLPKWQMHQTKQIMRSTKRYRMMTFHPNSFVPDRLEVEIDKGLRRPVVIEDIPVDPDFERRELLRLVRRHHKLGKQILARLGNVPEAEPLSDILSQCEAILEQFTQDGNKQMRLFL